jgi:hypothetical protein
MTDQDKAYADALNLLGSNPDQPKPVQETLHRLHVRAKMSHKKAIK